MTGAPIYTPTAGEILQYGSPFYNDTPWNGTGTFLILYMEGDVAGDPSTAIYSTNPQTPNKVLSGAVGAGDEFSNAPVEFDGTKRLMAVITDGSFPPGDPGATIGVTRFIAAIVKPA